MYPLLFWAEIICYILSRTFAATWKLIWEFWHFQIVARMKCLKPLIKFIFWKGHSPPIQVVVIYLFSFTKHTDIKSDLMQVWPFNEMFYDRDKNVLSVLKVV